MMITTVLRNDEGRRIRTWFIEVCPWGPGAAGAQVKEDTAAAIRGLHCKLAEGRFRGLSLRVEDPCHD